MDSDPLELLARVGRSGVDSFGIGASNWELRIIPGGN